MPHILKICGQLSTLRLIYGQPLNYLFIVHIHRKLKMTIQSWLMYLTLVFVATATPGPAVLFIMTNSTMHGWRKASFAALGNIIGLFCLGIIAVTGLGTILKTSEIIFNIIKYAGAAYLVYLGLKLIFQKNLDFTVMKEKVISNDISSQSSSIVTKIGS